MTKDGYKRSAIETSLKHMFKKEWLDICVIKECIQVAGIIPSAEDVRCLSVLHCVHWDEMGEELREESFKRILNLFESSGFDLAQVILWDEKRHRVKTDGMIRKFLSW